MAQQTSQQTSSDGHKRLRKMFGKIHEVAEMPNLIEVQKQSYDQFLMVEEPEGGRADEGAPGRVLDARARSRRPGAS